MRHQTAIAVATVSLALAASCGVPPEPPPPAAQATCEAACARWRALGCLEGADTPEGESCEAVCALWERYWDLDCMATVDSCGEIAWCP